MNLTPLNLLDPDEAEFQALLADSVVPSLREVAPGARKKAQLMDLLEVPRTPIEPTAYVWVDVAPGLKLHVVSEDVARGVRRCLVWGTPGASTPRHDHGGDEVILVLEGQLKDDHGEYGPGDICRSSAGDVHEEQVVGDDDCICFVLYYGDLIPV